MQGMISRHILPGFHSLTGIKKTVQFRAWIRSYIHINSEMFLHIHALIWMAVVLHGSRRADWSARVPATLGGQQGHPRDSVARRTLTRFSGQQERPQGFCGQQERMQRSLDSEKKTHNAQWPARMHAMLSSQQGRLQSYVEDKNAQGIAGTPTMLWGQQ